MDNLPNGKETKGSCSNHCGVNIMDVAYARLGEMVHMHQNWGQHVAL